MRKFIILSLILCLAVSCQAAPTLETDESSVPITSQLSDLDKYDILDLGDQIQLVDELGERVTLPKRPQRVVCGYNSYVDLWYKLGGELVGRIKPSPDKPVPAAEGVDIIGDNKALNEEIILSLEPDLVILASGNNQLLTAENLKQADIPTLVIDAKDLAEYVRLVRVLSAILDDETAYQELGVEVEQEVKSIIDRVPKTEAPKILLMNDTTTAVNVSSSQNMTGEMLRDLGAINLADGVIESDQSAAFSLEQILIEDPDVIFLREMGSDSQKVRETRQKEIEDSPVWQTLRAVQNDAFYILDKDLFTFKPNERYAEAYLSLAKILYPESFE